MRKVAVLLLPEFSNFSLAAVTEPMFIANWLAQEAVFEWHCVSLDGKPVRASNGSVAAVAGDPALAESCASIFVLASFEPVTSARDRALVRWLRRVGRSGRELVGIENGSLALAAAGLLEEHAAAVHWDNLAGFQELFPRIRIARASSSFSKQRITCAGAAAILRMMVDWIGRHADRAMAEEVSRHLLLSTREELRVEDDASSEGGRPRSNVETTVDRARALMRAHVDDILSCDVLAGRLGISLRQLERQFKQALRHTVHTEYRLVRAQRAHQYLQQTDLPVAEVAALTGFSSVEYFSKVYKRLFGVLPSRDRRQSTDAPVFRLRS
jgi:AraC family carnitine catabolism transcriptional activator